MTVVDWEAYLKCPQCGALLARPCRKLSGFVVAGGVAVGLEGGVVEVEADEPHAGRKRSWPIGAQFLIYSNHHKLWWGADGRGYTGYVDRAGRYELAATKQWLTRGCGCCLVPEVPVPAPEPQVIADPEALRKYARYKPQVATRRAKLAGRVNRYFEAGGR